MAHSGAVSVLYLLESVEWLILELLLWPLPAGASRLDHSRAVSVLNLQEHG